MLSRNLVICDQEEKYASALAGFFMKTQELALGVQVCNSVAQALKLQEESPIDILLIGSGYPTEDRKKVKAGNVFVLAQSENAALEHYGRGNRTMCPVWRAGKIFPRNGKKTKRPDHRNIFTGTSKW